MKITQFCFQKSLLVLFLFCLLTLESHSQSLYKETRFDTTAFTLDVDVTSNGNIYLLTSDKVKKFDSNYNLLQEYKHGIINPDKIVVSKSDTIFILGSSVVEKHCLSTIPNAGTVGGDGTYYPLATLSSVDAGVFTFNGMDIDAQGNLNITNSDNSSILKYNSNFNFISSTVALSDCYMLSDIAIAANGNMYAIANYGSTIVKFGSTGAFIKSWHTGGEYTAAHVIAVDALENVYIVDRNDAKVYKSNRSGTPVAMYYMPMPVFFGWLGSTPPAPTNLEFDPSGNMFLVGIFSLSEYTFQPTTYVTAPATNQVDIDPLQVRLDVKAVKNATSYKIEIDTDSTFSNPKVLISTRTYMITSLTYGKKYFTRAYSNLNPVAGAVSSFRTLGAETVIYVVSPANNAVNVPMNVTVKARAYSGATSYTFEVSSDSTFTTDVRTQTSTTNSTVFVLLPFNTKFYTRVRANVTAGKWGAKTSFSTIALNEATYTSSPINKAVNVNPINLQITSTAFSIASEYTIEVSENPEFNSATDTIYSRTSMTSSVVFSELTYDRTYYTRVKTNMSGYGPVKSFKTLPAYKATKIISPSKNATNVPISVNVVSANIMGGAQVYMFELTTDSTFTTNVVIQFSNTTSYRFTGLMYSTKYFVRVRTNISQTTPSVVSSFTTISNPAMIRVAGEESIVEESESTVGINVFPNPSTVGFNVSVQGLVDEQVELYIVDLMGVVKEQTFVNSNQQVSVGATLLPGAYILYVKSKAGVESKNIIKY